MDDRGSQYASQDYRDLLQAAGIRQSMSRKGCCYDNAPMESFFHTLKVELVHRTRFETYDQARREVLARNLLQSPTRPHGDRIHQP